MAYKFLYDEEELRKWFDVLVPNDDSLLSYESLFLSLAARNKYIDKEKEEANLNKTYMFNRSLVNGKNKKYLWNNFLIAIRRLEVAEGGYKIQSKKGDYLVDIPNEAMVVYSNINPVNNIQALLVLKDSIAKIEKELWVATANKNSTQNCFMDIARLDYLAEQSYGKAPSKRRWFDVDIDYEFVNDKHRDHLMKILWDVTQMSLAEIIEENKFDKSDFVVINTANGFHILFAVELCGKLKKGPDYILNLIRDKVINNIVLIKSKEIIFYKECKLNDNGIVPLPGTKQGNTIVKLLDLF